MLGKADATPMIAVKDLDRARNFYEDTLGLKRMGEWGEGVTLESGDTRINLYRSEFAGTNKATALTFQVDDAARVFERAASFRHPLERLAQGGQGHIGAHRGIGVRSSGRMAWHAAHAPRSR